jgi:hypothetical protein
VFASRLATIRNVGTMGVVNCVARAKLNTSALMMARASACLFALARSVALTGAVLNVVPAWVSRKFASMGNVYASSDGCGGVCGTCAADNTVCETGKCACTGLNCGNACCAVGQACIGGKCPPPGTECDDGNAIEWDGCTGGKITEFQVNSHATNTQEAPDVSALAGGGYVVVWHSNHNYLSSYSVYARLFDDEGIAGGQEFQANTFTANSQMSASVTGLKNGEFAVVWESQEQDGSFTGIFGQVFSADAALLGSEFQANTFTNFPQSIPDSCALPNGGFTSVWQSGLSYTVSKTKTQDGSGNGVYAQRLNWQGSPVGGEFRANTTTLHDQRSPAAASEWGSDRFVIVWSNNGGKDGSGSGIYGQEYTPTGGKLGSEFQINTYTNGDQWVPCVAMSSDGKSTAVWDSSGQDGDSFGVFGQTLTASGAKEGVEFQVNSYSTGSQMRPTIARHNDGRFVVAWQGAGLGDASGVYMQRFDATGAKVGDETLVHSYTGGIQGEASVAVLTDGNFIVVWSSADQDGDKYGIFAQRFDKDGNKVYK